jgi:hypothetical protein
MARRSFCSWWRDDVCFAQPDVAHIEMVEQVAAVPNAAPFVDGVVFH